MFDIGEVAGCGAVVAWYSLLCAEGVGGRMAVAVKHSREFSPYQEPMSHLVNGSAGRQFTALAKGPNGMALPHRSAPNRGGRNVEFTQFLKHS